MGTPAAATTPEVDQAAISVFSAPEQPRVVIIDSPWMGLAVPIGVDVETIEVPIVSDMASRREADKVMARLVELVPFTEEGSERRAVLNEAIEDLANDMGWFDGDSDA